MVRALVTTLAGLIATSAGAQPVDCSWLRGANYVPSYARNDVQIWMDYDPTVIDRELGYAARLRLNCVRIFLQFAVYEHDRDAFLERFESFLALCDRHGIRAMPVLFDSCLGEPPDLETYRDTDWVANPGQERLGPVSWPLMEAYCRDVVGRHVDDGRIVMWDVMNEPLCTPHAGSEEGRARIWAFLHHMLAYVNDLDDSHPTTVGFMSSQSLPEVIDEIDVLGFHNYNGDMAAFTEDVRWVKALGREHGKPVIINEVARRPHQTFEEVIPVLDAEGIGWCFWELMLGSTQFSRGDSPIQGVIYPDGTCRDPVEIAAIVGIVAQGRQEHAERGPGEINDTDNAVLYSDGWTLWEGEGPRRGTLHFANTPGAQVEVVFHGTEIHLVHKLYHDCGIAKVLIDGEPATEVDGLLDTYVDGIEWSHRTLLATGLAPGRHVLTITVTGETHPDATNGYIQVVGFDVSSEQ